jgi:hypothetical protein
VLSRPGAARRRGHLTAALIGLPMPTGAEEADHWEDDGTGTWTRNVHGQHRSIRGYDATVIPRW